MTFLSPSVLWFLGALCVPILIHLLNRFKQNKLEFSTIRFIKDLETSAIKKIKMQKIDLLSN